MGRERATVSVSLGEEIILKRRSLKPIVNLELALRFSDRIFSVVEAVVGVNLLVQ